MRSFRCCLKKCAGISNRRESEHPKRVSDFFDHWIFDRGVCDVFQKQYLNVLFFIDALDTLRESFACGLLRGESGGLREIRFR